jgi:hypothetical protein
MGSRHRSKAFTNADRARIEFEALAGVKGEGFLSFCKDRRLVDVRLTPLLNGENPERYVPVQK